MKKVLITGGAGFVGNETVKYLIANDYKVIIFDKNNNLDILDRDLLDKSMKEVDFVIHLAAVVSVQETIQDPQGSYKTNVLGTRNVFELAIKNGVKKVIYASSAAVYGDNQNLPLKESEALKPLSPYGEHKMQNEIDAQEFSKKSETQFIGLRYFNIFGPGQKLFGGYPAVIPNFIVKSLKGENVPLAGDGSNTRDFVFVEDIAKINVACLENEIKNSIMNVCTKNKISLNDLCDKIREKVPSLKINYLPSRKGDIKHSVGDNSLLMNNLKFEFTDFDLAFEKTFKFYKKGI